MYLSILLLLSTTLSVAGVNSSNITKDISPAERDESNKCLSAIYNCTERLEKCNPRDDQKCRCTSSETTFGKCMDEKEVRETKIDCGKNKYVGIIKNLWQERCKNDMKQMKQDLGNLTVALKNNSNSSYSKKKKPNIAHSNYVFSTSGLALNLVSVVFLSIV